MLRNPALSIEPFCKFKAKDEDDSYEAKHMGKRNNDSASFQTFDDRDDGNDDIEAVPNNTNVFELLDSATAIHRDASHLHS